jgi:uncharacterized Zn-finger protein
MEKNICNTCQKTFSTKHTLKRHMQRHVLDKEKTKEIKHYKCKYCNKSYTSKMGLKYHHHVKHTIPTFTIAEEYKRENNLNMLDEDWFKMQTGRLG